MPEKHLSAKELDSLYDWLSVNATEVSDAGESSGWLIGYTNEPLIITEDLDLENSGEVEADVYYPTGLKDKLSESGVVFERGQTQTSETPAKIREYAPGTNPSEW